MISYFIELNEYKPQNRKCAEMAEFANQFGNTLCPDKISFDAFKTELEAKVKELNEKYPKNNAVEDIFRHRIYSHRSGH